MFYNDIEKIKSLQLAGKTQAQKLVEIVKFFESLQADILLKEQENTNQIQSAQTAQTNFINSLITQAKADGYKCDLSLEDWKKLFAGTEEWHGDTDLTAQKFYEAGSLQQFLEIYQKIKSYFLKK